MARNGKGGGTLADSIRDINKQRNKAFKEAGNEFGVASDANAAGAQNMRRQLGRAEKTLDKTISRTTQNVKQLSKRAKEVQRQTRAKQAASVSRYGTSLGASVNQQFQGARAASEAGVQGMRGARTVAARGANMAKGVEGIARQGARAQEAAGDYALAQALQARYSVSADAAFQAKQALRLQQLEFEQQKKLMELENKEAAGGVPGITQTVSSAASAAPELMRFMSDPNIVPGAAGKYATAAEAAAYYIQTSGVTDENESTMIYAMARKMWGAGAGFVHYDTGTVDQDEDGWFRRPGGIAGQQEQIITTAASQTFATLFPEMWRKHKDDIVGNLSYARTAWLLQSSTQAPQGEDPGVPPSSSLNPGTDGSVNPRAGTGASYTYDPGTPAPTPHVPEMTMKEAEAEADRMGLVGRQRAIWIAAHT